MIKNDILEDLLSEKIDKYFEIRELEKSDEDREMILDQEKKIQKIKDKLEPSDLDIVEQYIEKLLEQKNEDNVYFYNQGVKDGINLLNSIYKIVK